MDTPRTVDTVVDVDYGQFYAMRAGSEWASGQVPSEAYEEYLWSNGAFVYIGTTRQYGPTPLRVEVFAAAPTAEPPDDWQHVAEVSLDQGGDLEVYSWGDDTPVTKIPVDQSPLRLRVAWRGLRSDRAESLDVENSDEELLFQLWPAEHAEPGVTRWWVDRIVPARTDRSPQGRRQVEGLEDVMERLPQLTALGSLRFPTPPMPDGGEHSHIVAVLTDPNDGSWWVDGYDVRRTLREVTEEEAQRFLESRTPDFP